VKPGPLGEIIALHASNYGSILFTMKPESFDRKDKGIKEVVIAGL